MRKMFSIAACLLPFAVATSAYSQGPSGRSGSDSAGVEAQVESTNPSGLAGSTGIKPDNRPADASSVSPTPNGSPTRAEPAATDGSQDAQAPNRSASGDSTHHSGASKPAATGDVEKPSKSRSPNSTR